MNKQEALRLIQNLTRASIRCYQAVNGDIRAKHASRDEDKAALAVLKHLTDEPITADDLSEALQ